MKKRFIIAISMIILAGCMSVPRNPCLWAIGKETEIVNKYNSRIDDLYDKHKKYEFIDTDSIRDLKPMLREDQKIKLVEVTPNGSKMRITYNNGETKISVQDEFNHSYLFSKRFDRKEPGSNSYTPIFYKIQLKKEDF